MWNFIKSIFIGSGGNSIAGKALDIASEKIEDVDKLNGLLSKAIDQSNQMEIARLNTSTIPWVDALHKMMRPIMWVSVIMFYAYCKLNSIPVDITEFAILVSGPGAYTLLKGRGR